MTVQTWLIFLTLTIVAAATPGPAVLFIMTKSISYGWKKTIYSALGNIIAILIMGIITISGLGVILITSELVFNIIKYIGAAYLVYLGVKIFFQRDTILYDKDGSLEVAHVSSIKLFFQAFGVAISNPKAIVFLTAIFPQFLNMKEPLAIQFTILISTSIISSFSFLMIYAMLAHKVKILLNMPHRVKFVNRLSGTLFMGIGVLLATSSKK
jgi:threonine/homoserine/homoserine lactone efflux protein